jgi:hypothetical protein
MCEAIPCDGKPAEKGCGGTGTMLAYQFTCDKAEIEQGEPGEPKLRAPTP